MQTLDTGNTLELTKKLEDLKKGAIGVNRT